MNLIREASIDFWEALQRGTIPEKWRGRLSGDEGYGVQLAVQNMHDAAGDRRIGWKVAATSPGVREQLGLEEPAFGSLRLSRHFDDGYAIDVRGLMQPHAECELCFELNAEIAKIETPEEMIFAIASCFPSFEISEKRVPISDFGFCMADNAEHTAIVLGTPVYEFEGIDFRRVECQLTIDGQDAGSATGEAVFGDPLNSIFWLKERLKRFGEVLEEGALVMTGSFIRQTPIQSGRRFMAQFSGIGEVRIESLGGEDRLISGGRS